MKRLTELMYVFLSQTLFPACQLDNLVLINKIKEQLMSEKIRPPHLPAASTPSQQPLVAPPTQADGIQHAMSKAQQMAVLHSHSPSDIAMHARPASTSVTGNPKSTDHNDSCTTGCSPPLRLQLKVRIENLLAGKMLKKPHKNLQSYPSSILLLIYAGIFFALCFCE